MAVLSRILLSVFVVASGSREHQRSHLRHEHRGSSVSPAALQEADDSAEAVVEEAEREGDVGTQAPKAPVMLKAETGEGKDDEGEKDDSDSDDKDDGNDDDTPEKPAVAAMPTAAPHESYPYPQPKSISPGQQLESLTPQGKLAKARQRLQDNIIAQARIAKQMSELRNTTGFEKKVDAEADGVANETNATQLAKLLGGMRKEMRKFASPFYIEHLAAEREKLKSLEVGLQSDLSSAELAVGIPGVIETKMALAQKEHRRSSEKGAAAVVSIIPHSLAALIVYLGLQ